LLLHVWFDCVDIFSQFAGMLTGCRLPEVREMRAKKDKLREPGNDQAKENIVLLGRGPPDDRN
jgi:hypothetical protein